MANIIVPFVSVEGSIYNEIYHQVARDVVATLGLNEKTNIVLYNSVETVRTDLRSNVKTDNEINTPNTVSKKTLEVRVTREFDEELFDTELINRMGNYSVFRDTDIGCAVTPIYLAHKFEFNFTYKSTKTDIEALRDLIRIHLGRGLNFISHELEYTMIFPEFVENFIETLHELKSRLYPISLDDYFKQNSTNRLHAITDMSNIDNALLAVREKQVQAEGYFDLTDTPPEMNVDNTSNEHTLEITYHLNITLPKSISILFEPMICNKLMPTDFLIPLKEKNKRRLDMYLNTNLHIGRTNEIASYFNTVQTNVRRRTFPYPINIPDFDNYRNAKSISGYGQILSVLVEVDETDKKTLFNLKELDPWGLTEPIMEYLKDPIVRNRVCTPYKSFIYFGIQQEGRYFNHDLLTIDEDLNVRSRVELDLLRPIRVIINGLIDLTYLDDKSQSELMQDDILFDIFIREYLELKDDFLTNATMIDPKDKEDNLIRLLVHKLKKHLDANEVISIHTLLDLISEEKKTAYALGRMMTIGFPNLREELQRKGIAYIDGRGYLKPMSRNSFKVSEQLKETNQYNYTQIDARFGSPTVPHRDQVEMRSRISLGLPRHVMYKSVVALKGGL